MEDLLSSDSSRENPLVVRSLRLISTLPIGQKVDANLRGSDINVRLTGLIPFLNQVRKLQIIDRYSQNSPSISLHGPPWLQLTLETLAPTLTVLSLSLGAIKFSLPLIQQGAVSLPMLRILTLHYDTEVLPNVSHLCDTLNNLTSRSQFLEEVLHKPLSKRISPREAFWLPKDSTLHPNLHIFKVLPVHKPSETSSIISNHHPQNLHLFFHAFKLQLRILHFDARHTGILEDIQYLRLKELRINASALYDVVGLQNFHHLEKMNLEVLEISGQNNVLRFLPSMVTLRELYFPIDKDTFSMTTLNDIASKTPDLKKLVLRFEQGLSLPIIAPAKLQEIIKRFREPTSPNFLMTWGREDVGILNPSVFIPSEYVPLMESIVEAIPSIQNLYGRPKGVIQAGERVENRWDGELQWIRKR
ncbi:hypothetical protein DL96DRAFT_1638528 [Flagelloscypha sp. PMI_526]|nr:hypothetical protein DL96DRAFT_1638528 [Flagelloscypha sp. PMI_526]